MWRSEAGRMDGLHVRQEQGSTTGEWQKAVQGLVVQPLTARAPNRSTEPCPLSAHVGLPSTPTLLSSLPSVFTPSHPVCAQPTPTSLVHSAYPWSRPVWSPLSLLLSGAFTASSCP